MGNAKVSSVIFLMAAMSTGSEPWSLPPDYRLKQTVLAGEGIEEVPNLDVNLTASASTCSTCKVSFLFPSYDFHMTYFNFVICLNCSKSEFTVGFFFLQ